MRSDGRSMASEWIGDEPIPSAAESCDIMNGPRALVKFRNGVQAVNDVGSRCRIFTGFGLVVLTLGMYGGARELEYKLAHEELSMVATMRVRNGDGVLSPL